MRVRGPDHERVEPPHLLLQQTHGVVELVAAQRIGTDELRELTGLVHSGPTHRSHFVQHDTDAERRGLPCSLATGKAAPDDVDHVKSLSPGGFARGLAGPRRNGGRRTTTTRGGATARRGRRVAARFDMQHRPTVREATDLWRCCNAHK